MLRGRLRRHFGRERWREVPVSDRMVIQGPSEEATLRMPFQEWEGTRLVSCFKEQDWAGENFDILEELKVLGSRWCRGDSSWI